MPNIKSAIKRVKVSQTKTLRNRMVKSNLKTAIKKFETALADNDLEKARLLLSRNNQKIDMAVTKGTIHKNAANRKRQNWLFD